ncbi:MAG: glycosyl transferase, family 2 [Herbaspirillum sp.]|nr:glycosyl transferase, family 2 [Herbaspirillum sp.]
MVFNQAARKLLAITANHEDVVSHDWWTYMLVTGNGGQVFYDAYPAVRYRQHGNNMAGQNITLMARMARIKALFAGRYTTWNDANIKALNEVRDVLTEENRIVLDIFASARKKTFIPRLIGVIRSGVYRQPFLGNLSFFVAVILNKL